MAVSTLKAEQHAFFQFKASFLPCTILQITQYDLAGLELQLVNTIQKAPNFFIGSPVVIDIERAEEAIDFAAIKQLLIANGMAPIGIRGGNPDQQAQAQQQGLSVLKISKVSMAEPIKTTVEEPLKSDKPIHQATKMVSTPIRSGAQVYAKDSDLIVTAAVSAGAELFADGHIHVYGVLRGRALAGVQGNKEAKIFCRSLDAELVSIAGYYLTKEDIQALSLPEGMMQIYLDNEQVRIEAI